MTIDRKYKSYDPSKVVDLNDEEAEGMLDENIIVQKEDQDKLQKGQKGSRKGKQQTADDKAAEELFTKEYMKMGGIQHIVCSATMTIDNKGRITPRQEKIMKKKKIETE